MPKVDLSVIIPSRQEMFLKRTVEDILKNMRGETEVIVGLDGDWADPPLDDHPKVHIIHHSKSIGQRAITNEGARLSTAKYLMKCDAHCCFDEGFDVKMMADMQDNWTMVPLMKNFHVFNWICKKCGDIRYQGPTPVSCPKCDNTTDFHREIIWFAKGNPLSTSYCFDSEPHFQYFREFKNRPEGKGDITETMSLQGSCFMVTRDKYFELNLSDETFGSWGSQGIEVAVKTWLSGGRVVCNHKTWYGHCFRTQGGDFGFPYDISGRQVERAKKYARDLFFNNKWEKQIYPLSWLIDKFKPVPGWHDESGRKVLAQVIEAGNLFSVSKEISILRSPGTDSASSASIEHNKTMPTNTMSLSGIDSGRAISSDNILLGEDQLQMKGVTTGSVITDVIRLIPILGDASGERMNKPSEQKPMNFFSPSIKENSPIAIAGRCVPSPIPTTSHRINLNLRENSLDSSCGKGGNSEIIGISHDSSSSDGLGLGVGQQDERCPIPNILPQSKPISKGIIYYTDNRLDKTIFNAVQRKLLNSCNGNEIISVSLEPIDFGKNIVLNLKRGHLAMAKQQLVGLEASTADIIFFCEHDCLYPKEHFDFIPPRSDTYYYDLNWFKVRVSDGQALHFKAKQVSGLCAYRDILIDYYRKRVTMIESGEIGGRRHFEPGGHQRDAYDKLTNLGFDTWFSEIPYVDIRHDATVTRNIFDPSGYRGQVTDWTMADEIPSWGRTKGRFNEFLQEAISK